MVTNQSKCVPATPPSPKPTLLAAWPGCTQWTTAFLLGVAATVLAIQGWGQLGWKSRPAVLEPGYALQYRIDLNRADRAELLQLPGIGEQLASRIENYRREHSHFQSVDQLLGVKGIGPATMARLRDWVVVEQDEIDLEGPAAVQKPVAALAKKPTGSSEGKPDNKKAAAIKEPINLNTAGPEELQKLPGIGPKTAQKIVEARRIAPFQSIEDLRRIKGIGIKTLEKVKPFVTVSTDSQRLVTQN
jgi:competence protein ComEA